MAKGNQKDLYHGTGNQTAKLPGNLKGRKKLTDPHTSPGKLEKGLRKKTQDGWNK